MRRSGVLLPISAIPSKYGIGTFSKEAYEFVDFLERAGQRLWQILPLGPTGCGDSPYQSFSTFAGNPYYIDPEALIREGYLTKEECDACDFGDSLGYIDYGKIYNERFALLRKAYDRSGIAGRQEFQDFKRENADWLEDYALYMAVKASFDSKGWNEWDEDIKLRRPSAVAEYKEKYAEEIEFYQFQQYLFAAQWSALKAYANQKGIEIIGDIPIYVAFDSADTWIHPQLFQLDEQGNPLAVAGCPPDAFSATGQLWGNPLYRWEYHKETAYEWWMRRLEYCYRLYDIVRIDHFRGFDEYYSIPYGNPTAEFGRWEAGPGYDIFRVMKEKLGEKAVIAEDLGYLTPSVHELIRQTGYPGMKVLQFAFNAWEDNDYLPHNCVKNSIIYTGTHDNDTTAGWYASMNGRDREYAGCYLNIAPGQNERDVVWAFIRSALASVADTAVIPMQDYLALGSEARINIPSTLGSNWRWRLLPGQCTEELAGRIRDMTRLYARI